MLMKTLFSLYCAPSHSMSSLKYRALSPSGREEAGAAHSSAVDTEGMSSTSLQPYITDNRVDKQEEDDPFYKSIEAYNKNNNVPTTTTSSNRLIHQQPQSVSAPTTPTRRHQRQITRSSSPIPELLRSASSMLSQTMKLPPGSLRASTFTVITGMVGGGTFTFSYGVYMAGMWPALLYCLAFSLKYLVMRSVGKY